MAKYVLVGCDLHDESMLLKIAADKQPLPKRGYANDGPRREKMIADLRKLAGDHGGAEIVFAYEACGLGFVLHDELTAAGICCHVLAPSLIERSPKQRRRKTDDRDAELVLKVLQSHVLAGLAMPSIWIPSAALRDDRELVRRRLDVAANCCRVKSKVRWLLKRWGLDRPKAVGSPWSDSYWTWVRGLSEPSSASGLSRTLKSLLDELEWMLKQKAALESEVFALSKTDRWCAKSEALTSRFVGVGLMTSMVFLTELGEMSRFTNRRQLGSYLGLTPSSHESGQRDDCKGHITHQGPSRVRKMLCQATWCRARWVPSERLALDRLSGGKPGRRKAAVVARMRVLGIAMWHCASSV